MAALTANANVPHFTSQEFSTYDVLAATQIYQGSLVGLDVLGYARPLQSGDVFAGIAFEEADNTLGSNGTGSPSIAWSEQSANRVKVYTSGDFALPCTGADRTWLNGSVYGSDSGLVAKSGPNPSRVGQVIAFISATQIRVRLAPRQEAIL